jgi:hypothetical protein
VLIALPNETGNGKDIAVGTVVQADQVDVAWDTEISQAYVHVVQATREIK